MLKKFSVLALAGMLCLPGLALAGGGAADLGSQIDDLQRQIEQLKKDHAHGIYIRSYVNRFFLNKPLRS